MRLYTFLSDHYQVLHDRFFMPSLKIVEPLLELNVHHFKIDGDTTWGSKVFATSQIIKWKKIYEALWKHNGESIMFCDIDILFRKPFVADIEKTCESVDFAMQFNGTSGNVGVMYFKCNDACRTYVSRVMEKAILTGEWDEKIANDELFKIDAESSLAYSFLPTDRYASYYVQATDAALLYHAAPSDPIWGPTLDTKIQLLQLVENGELMEQRCFIPT